MPIAEFECGQSSEVYKSSFHHAIYSACWSNFTYIAEIIEQIEFAIFNLSKNPFKLQNSIKLIDFAEGNGSKKNVCEGKISHKMGVFIYLMQFYLCWVYP